MGGKSNPPPDYSGMEQVAREQLRFAQQQYQDLAPIAQGIGQAQIAAQTQQMEQAQDYYNYMQETFRPVEQSLVAQAQTLTPMPTDNKKQLRLARRLQGRLLQLENPMLDLWRLEVLTLTLVRLAAWAQQHSYKKVWHVQVA